MQHSWLTKFEVLCVNQLVYIRIYMPGMLVYICMYEVYTPYAYIYILQQCVQQGTNTTANHQTESTVRHRAMPGTLKRLGLERECDCLTFLMHDQSTPMRNYYCRNRGVGNIYIYNTDIYFRSCCVQPAPM